MNPDERLPGMGQTFETLKDLPPGVQLPAGIDRKANEKDWYVQSYTTADGRTFYEFYRRGAGGGPGQPDPVHATVQGPTNTEVADKFAKDKEKSTEAPPTRVVGGVVQERGPDGVYRPVQTATGAATATTTSTTASGSGGKPFIDDDEKAGATGRRWGWNPETRLYDRDLGPSPAAQEIAANQAAGKGAKTNAQVEADAKDQTGKPTGNTRTRSANGTTVKETEYLLPDGSKEWRSQTEVGEPDRVGKPTGNTRTRNENGQVVKETEYVLADGTKEWRTESAPSTTNQPLPAGMPAFRPDPNKEGMGLIEYAQQLTALRSQGKLTDKQFTEFVGLAHQQATAEAGRLDTIRAAQQQLQANAISQRNADLNASVNRLNSANSATQNALETSQKMASNFTPTSYAAMGGPILPALMAIQDARAGAWGGLNNPAPIGAENYPMLAALQGMGMRPGGAVPPVEQLVAGAQPNAIGAGAVPGAITPGRPSSPLDAPSPTAAPAAPAPAPTVSAPAMASPVAPAAPVAAPTPGQNPDAGQALGPTGNSGPLPTPGVNPDAGQGLGPTGNSGPLTAPSVPGPIDYTSPGAPELPDSFAGSPAGGNVQMAPPVILPGVLQAGIMSELSGKYPPDVLAEAARMVWG